MRALCLHGHFYQPPREHPWLGVVDPEASAAPYRDWNTRITAECYAPNAAARVLDGAGRLADVVNVYQWTSYDFGPTLLGWFARHRPRLLATLRAADHASRARTGHGNAWAQAYGHPILPLSSPRDVHTQVTWGRREFEHRFGRPPEGMWLPEMAVDVVSLTALAAAGVTLTMLAPHQARRVRALGAGDDAWRDVSPATLDTRRLYRCVLPEGRAVDVVFRDHGVSEAVAFGGLLQDGTALAARLRQVVTAGPEPALVTIAVDGETYGHHHRFGEMALAAALRTLRAESGLSLVGPAAYRAAHPPTHELEIAERTSWSCVHGVERWRGDCGCRIGGLTTGSQAWRAPLREAIDWLRDQLAVHYESVAGEVLRDPWGARDRYIDCVLEPGKTAAFLATEASGRLSPAATLQARRALEVARHALLMQTSCGWFFDELTGIEPVQILRHAARALELTEGPGGPLEREFEARLEPARSNLPQRENGAQLYRRAARGAAAPPARVAATGAMLTLAGEPAEIPGYDVGFSASPEGGQLVADARVSERVTGAVANVPVVADTPGGGAVECRAGGATYTLADLFGTQRERLLWTLARNTRVVRRGARAAALAKVRPALDALLEAQGPLPPALAALLGWEGAETIVRTLGESGRPLPPLVAQVEALRRAGAILPARWLGRRLTRALETRLEALPGGVEDALTLLELAAAAGLKLDLHRAQVQALAWWRASTPAARSGPPFAALRDRLGLALEDS